MTNDLIAAPEDQTHWYTGLGIAESIADIVLGVESENWVEAGIGIFATAAEGAAWATDPFGQLIQHGTPICTCFHLSQQKRTPTAGQESASPSAWTHGYIARTVFVARFLIM